MMTKPTRLLLTAIVFVVANVLHAQQKDSLEISKNQGKIDTVKSTVADTLATDIERSVEQMEQMDETSDQDLPLPLADGKGKYNLKDHPQAAIYDSLWMKELYETNLQRDVCAGLTTRKWHPNRR